MATNKTDFLNLNDWVGTDPFRREEINANFRTLDAKAKEHEDSIDGLTSNMAESASLIEKPSFADLTPLISQYNANIVFAGDSLAFNRYDFQSAVTEANEAKAGILSWSFMLRDAIHRHDGYFVNAEEMNFDILNPRVSTVYNTLNAYYAPFNGRFAQFGVSPTTEISFKYTRDILSSKVVLYVMPISSAETSLEATTYNVYINDTLVKSAVSNSKSVTPATFEGKETDLIELDIPVGVTTSEIIIKIKDFTGTTPTFRLHGVGTIKRNVYMTGRGGWKSSDVLGDINNRILSKNPNILFLILGANDLYNGVTSSQFKTNMESIIQQVRALNNSCEIVLLTPPSMRSETTPNVDDNLNKSDVFSLPYINVIRQLAKDYDCHIINIFQVFKNQKISDWRYDNVHFKKYGNTILANTIVKQLFPNLKGDRNLINSNNAYGSQVRYKYPSSGFKPQGNGLYFSWNGSAFVKNGSYFGKNDIVSAINKVTDNRIEVVFTVDPFTNLQTLPSIIQFGTPTVPLTVNLRDFTGFKLNFHIKKITDGSYTVAGDWNTTDFKFFMSYI